LPGTALETITLTNAMSTALLGSIVTANSTLHPTLISGNSYWLVADANADAHLGWFTSNPDTISGPCEAPRADML
jgi:hypothetical protein